jgi:hypothetical protein
LPKSSISCGSLVSLFVLAIVIKINVPFYCDVSAQLDSFPHQELNAGSKNGFQVNGTANTPTLADYKDKLDNSSDIQKVTYFSDGKNLNATLWLGSNLSKNPKAEGASKIGYGVMIDVDNNPTTGKFGVDYQKEIQWSNKTQNWISYIVERSSPTHYRYFDIQNHSMGNQNDAIQNYVTLSLDLESITSPSKYRVLFYSVLVYDNNAKIVIDYTSWIDIPPATYTFSTLPSPLVIRQGERMDIGVQLKSSSIIQPQDVNFIPSQNYSDIKVIVQPDRSSNSSTSTSFAVPPSLFTIEVPKDAQVGQYSIPIMVNVSTGSLFPSKLIEIPTLTNITLPTNELFITKPANLSLSVIKPPTMAEQIKDFWSAYGALISLMGAGFIGGLSTYIFDYLKNRKKSGAPLNK